MPSLANITAKMILSFLKKEGFEVHHQKGSHIQLRKEGSFITVPFHGNKSLRMGTTLSILKQAGIEKKYFLDNV